MSESQDIKPRAEDDLVAPTPQNTPLNTAVLANRPAGLGKPGVEDVAEGDEDEGEDVTSMNPASLLASVSLLLLGTQERTIAFRCNLPQGKILWFNTTNPPPLNLAPGRVAHRYSTLGAFGIPGGLVLRLCMWRLSIPI